MTCRRPWGLFVAMLVGACGCSSLPTLGETGPKPDPEEPTHKASTYVAFGDFRARTAEAPETTPEAKRQLREEAKLSYLKAIEVDPKYLPAHVALARTQMAAEDHASAAQTYEKALALSPTDPALHYEMGMCRCRMKDWPAGLTSLRKALELEPNNRTYARAAGLAMARAGQLDEAFALLERMDGQAKAHYDLARMLKHVGNQADRARLHAAAALEADPHFEAARTLLAELNAKAPARQDAPRAPQARAEPTSSAEVIQTSYVEAQPDAAPVRVELNKPDEAPKEPTTQPDTTDRPIKMPPLPVIRLNGPRAEVAGNK